MNKTIHNLNRIKWFRCRGLAATGTSDDQQRAGYVADDVALSWAVKHHPSGVKGGGKRTTGVSLFRINVRLSVQRKCHSVVPRWYQMVTPWEPPGIVALEDSRHPGIS